VKVKFQIGTEWLQHALGNILNPGI